MLDEYIYIYINLNPVNPKIQRNCCTTVDFALGISPQGGGDCGGNHSKN
jgi:hypothetical protein